MSKNSLATFLDEHSIRFTRILPARIEVVWSYLTEPDLLATWLAEAIIDLRENGSVELAFDAHQAPRSYVLSDKVSGIIDQLNPPQHLTYSWNFSTSRQIVVHETHVGFELEEHGGGGENTTFILTHTRIPTEARARLAAAWQVHLEMLSARLKGEAPAPFEELYQTAFEAYRSLGFELP